MTKTLISTAIVMIAAAPVAAQNSLNLVEGAACAQKSAFIEDMERYNNGIYDEVGELQASDDRQKRTMANALLVHFDRMKEYRKKLISDFETKCARGTMTYSGLKSVCSPQANGISFAETVFCKPLKEDSQ